MIERFEPMPRERAGLFLRVETLDIRLLHTLTEEDAQRAGVWNEPSICNAIRTRQ
jgi:hypothetical protein